MYGVNKQHTQSVTMQAVAKPAKQGFDTTPSLSLPDSANPATTFATYAVSVCRNRVGLQAW